MIVLPHTMTSMEVQVEVLGGIRVGVDDSMIIVP